ncbi:MAG: pyridoxamine 5'-phosphate oxidase [Candidatus Eremiobacteraeota bacterium]|nr:pyridoxamine 5'-phosphate oxidase [Candidatus Eremiobacteraeota bacterium]
MNESEAARRSYLRARLSEEDLADDPVRQIGIWMQHALDAAIVEPYAMSLSTVSADGRPSSRVVLMRGCDERGLVFYTSYQSRKGRDIGVNPRVAALFYWPELERQIRVEGTAEQIDESESDDYFAGRPRGHQISAWASEQSEPLQSRDVLEQRVADYETRFAGEDVPRPHSWGGYLIRPERIEFWQGRENRMHDRIEFVRDGARWTRRRLSP